MESVGNLIERLIPCLLYTSHRRRESQELGVSSPHLCFEFWIGNLACGENFHGAILQAEIGWCLIGKKIIAGSDDAPVEVHEKLRGILNRLPPRRTAVSYTHLS